MSDLIERLQRMAALKEKLAFAFDMDDDKEMVAVCSEAAERIAELEADNARLRVDAAIGAVVWKYIDRMNDVVPSDPAERILCEFCHAVQPVMDVAKEQS